MENTQTLSNLLTALGQAKKLLIVYNGQTTLDIAACATSLFCLSKSRGQEVTIVSTSEPTVAHSGLVGIDKVGTKLDKRNLVIALDYDDTRVDKVVSHLDEINKKLLLVVSPKPEAKPIEEDSVHFSYEGVEYDKIVIFDVHQKSQLEKLLGGAGKNWATEKLISLGTRSQPDYNTSFCQLLESGDSLSADFAETLQTMTAHLGADLATNLMLGLEDKTAHFSQCDNPQVFTLAAWLLAQGARRHTPMPEKEAHFAKTHLPSLPKTDHSQTMHQAPSRLSGDFLPGGRGRKN